MTEHLVVSTICRHQQLARSCEFCELEAERDAARAEVMALKVDRDEWMASSAGYGSDMVEWKVRAQHAEAEVARLREALHEARIYVHLTRDLSTDRLVRMRAGTCLDRIDAALAGKADA